MPTTLPRLQVTLPQELYDAITRISKVSGQSKSRVILDVLEPATPFFQEVANLLETAGTLRAEPSKQLAENLTKIQQQLTGTPEGFSPRANQLLAELMREFEAMEASSPRSVTRGPKSSPPLSPLPPLSS